jgi:hypothetical protein
MAAEDRVDKTEEKATCVCPFCEEAMDPSAPWCATCEVIVRFCEACQEPLPQEATVCPECGAECVN